MSLQKISNKSINIIIIVISIAVPTLVMALLKITPPDVKLSFDLHFFPKFNAMLNSGTTICLLLGFIFIKSKQIKLHRASMMTAMLLSAIFLISYVFYHTLKAEDTKFGGEGIIRYIYYFILVTHIILAAIIMPLVLKTFAFALTNQIASHKKWAKITFPLWFYVAITGVLVYVFLAPYY